MTCTWRCGAGAYGTSAPSSVTSAGLLLATLHRGSASFGQYRFENVARSSRSKGNINKQVCCSLSPFTLSYHLSFHTSELNTPLSFNSNTNRVYPIVTLHHEVLRLRSCFPPCHLRSSQYWNITSTHRLLTCYPTGATKRALIHQERSILCRRRSLKRDRQCQGFHHICCCEQNQGSCLGGF